MKALSVSIITVSHNSIKTISDTIDSVLEQTYPNVEYIIIDNSSVDGTVGLVQAYGKKISRFVSEPDSGIYDAINKGIKFATGDIIGILNSDDIFKDNRVIEKIVSSFNDNYIDAVIGDVQFIDSKNGSRIVRYYSSRRFHPGKFKFGYMPAHPSFYVKRKLFGELGFYKTDYKIAADYELLIRFLYVNKVKYKYLEMPFVSMRTGGVSNRTFLSNIILNKEIARACKENGIHTNYLFIYSKYFVKMFEFIGNHHFRK
jgi:glycosyltransferase involved in cell wall biosynthesis